jgi:hypothetical protein
MWIFVKHNVTERGTRGELSIFSESTERDVRVDHAIITPDESRGVRASAAPRRRRISTKNEEAAVRAAIS